MVPQGHGATGNGLAGGPVHQSCSQPVAPGGQGGLSYGYDIWYRPQQSPVPRVSRYPAHVVKAAILRRRTVDLVWAPNKTTVEIHTAIIAYYEAYDRAVSQSRNLDATLVLSAQDWTAILTEMQFIFQPWVLAFITNFPARFTNMADCWEAIITKATRQAAGHKLGVGGRVNQIAAANTTVVGRLDGVLVNGSWLDFEAKSDEFGGGFLNALALTQLCCL